MPRHSSVERGYLARDRANPTYAYGPPTSYGRMVGSAEPGWLPLMGRYGEIDDTGWILPGYWHAW
ncbi:MAG TPA: hypothetical protein VLW50_04285 [Streptosporangiaceae bacterium]|nr:hypothetical protein [Streptosporangiaceae bacterium]